MRRLIPPIVLTLSVSPVPDTFSVAALEVISRYLGVKWLMLSVIPQGG